MASRLSSIFQTIIDMLDSTARRYWNDRPKGSPFVVLNIPFVCRTSPNILPFVCKNIPSVKIWRFRGFTAIELLITIVIASILITLALPNLRVFIQNNRLRTEASEFFAAVNQARTEAKTNATNVSLCVSTNQTACTGATWDLGWLAWVDTDKDGVVDGGEQILRARPAPGNGIVLSTADDTIVTFSADGSASADIDFEVCDSTRNGEEGRSIRITAASGLTRLQKKDGVTNPLCP